MSSNENKKPITQMTPREFVDALDELIQLRIEATITKPEDEKAEVIKREMTDYLLKSSAEGGIYVTGRKN